ncbi:MAG: hypothetical protein ACI9R3_002468 [Verrucomicrobiales bacterium]|jgi:hypothetical protein
MADTTTLQAVGDLLAPEHQERFAEILQYFEKLPEDDESFQLVTATGIVALTMSQIPEKVSDLLEEAQDVLTEDQTKALGDQFREILTSSLDVPNYKDMSEMTRAIRETYQKTHHASGKLLESLGSLQHEVAKSRRLSPILACSLASSLITLAAGAVVAFFWLPKLLDDPITIPKHLWPYVELQRERRLYHFDGKLPNLTDKEVRIMKIKEGVLGAFREGDDAVIVLEKPDQPADPIN